MPVRRARAWAVAVLLSVGALAPARAVEGGDSPDDEIAKRHFAVGQEAYAARDYPKALAEFEAARTVRPLPGLDYDIALCFDRMERPAEAIAAYERYLRHATPGADAVAAAARVEVLRARLPRPAVPRGALIAVGVVGVAALGTGAGLLGSTAASFDSLKSTCAPTCTTASWADLPGRRDAGVALVAVAGAALVTEIVLLAVRARAGAAR